MRSPSRLKLFLQLDIYHQEAPTGSGSGHASHHRRPNTRGASATLFRKTGTASRRCRRTHHRLLLHFIQYWPEGLVSYSILIYNIGNRVSLSINTRWLFEKYDGVRGFWNPEKKAFFSRNGNKLPVPQEVIDSMPRIYLDGEIWWVKHTVCKIFFLYLFFCLCKRFGRDSFQEALRVSSKAEFSRIDWSKFKYMVFDLPTHRGTYAERYQALGINSVAL